MNVFDKPDEQRQARLSYVMARKGARKRTFSISQMNKTKTASGLQWREKEGCNPTFIYRHHDN